MNPLRAGEGSVTYEKFYRLNKPLYRSESGDLINFSYETAKIDPNRELDFFAMGDLRLYFQDNNAINYSFQEGYIHYNGYSYKVDVGRKILDWNQNEKYWSLGYLNASQAFTLLSTEEEGVTGAIFSKKNGPFEFDILLSYLFIPQVNPAIDFKNGDVQSKSDWVRLPPKKTVINGTEVPIYYKIADYKISKIVLQKSLGGNLRYNWAKGGVSAFAVYKPENKLRANASAYYDNILLNKVIVEANPTVSHHAYYGLQIFQSFGDLQTRGGLSYVDPNARLGKDIPIYSTAERKTFTSDFFTINPRYDKEAYSHMSANLDRKYYILSLNYIHLLSKNIRASDDFFSDTIKWKRALGGSLTLVFNDSLRFLIDLKYDFARFDNIIKSEISYNYQNQVRVSLGLEVLKAPEDSSYWSYYRANDTLYSSVGFYF
ncbi:MAG: hypothetical protein Q7U04_06625 [Bacteriovorax sp.]|nr:hypothetical protein [Bacteriovorax sp.]